MKLLEAEPQVAPDGDTLLPETPADAVSAPAEPLPGDGLLDPVAEDVPTETGPTCRSCGTAIEPGQDWCLSCGTAVEAPRRLPGVRALGIAGVLTLVLTGGAVAAAAAAFKHEPPAQQTKVETVAQTTPAPTADTSTDALEPLPPLNTDTTAIPPADVTPITPDTSSVTPIPPVVTTPTTTTPTTTTPTTTTTEQPTSTRIVLSAGAGSLYDPGARATATGDPARAIDGNTGTSWFATVPAGSDMNVGYLVDLGDKTALSKLQLLTKTPGFTVQVFGATGTKAPETADDPKWTKLGEAGSVDGDPAEGAAPSVPPLTGDKAGDGKLVLPLDGGDKEYRQVLLWFTTPPAAGPTVRLSEIKLYD